MNKPPRGGRRKSPSLNAPPVLPLHELPTVHLKYKRNSPHPWIWRSMLNARRLPQAEAGDVVRVLCQEGNFVGQALYHPHVTIALRILTRDPEERVDTQLFASRFRRALELRREVLRLPETTDSFRLVHAEADDLSGLMVDVLGDVVLGEVFSLGMARQAPRIKEALSELFPEKRVVLRANRRTAEIEGFQLEPPEDAPATTVVKEHGVRFRVDLRHGHKTGFFLDQRDNRDHLSRIVRGRTVLDLHTYTGGFALHAACRGEARQVIGVDLDEKAVEVAQRNAKLNQAKVKFVQADAFHYLRQISDDRRPEVLVLDPPKLIKDAKELQLGMRTYADLNRLALEAMADEGFLVTCSCSGSVSEEAFLEMLRGAAARTQRELLIFRLAGAAADHPIGLHVPESRYLKAVFARVRRL